MSRIEDAPGGASDRQRADEWDAGALRQLAAIAGQRQRPDEAVSLLRRALAIEPDCLDTRLSLANRLAEMCRTGEAVAEYRRVLDRDRSCAAAWFNLGHTLQDEERFDEAAGCYERALQVEPRFRDARLNLGIVRRCEGRLDEARTCFDSILAADPQDAQAHLQRALTRLTAGEFPAGWDEYEWRWRAERQPRFPDAPLWSGGPAPQRTVLVYGEQGIGDEIMFASCVPEVLRRVRSCVLECDPRLVALFGRSFPGVRVVPRTVAGVEFDSCIPAGSLPWLFRRDLSSFPSHAGYLQPDPAAVQTWRRRFAQLGGGMTVGVAWRGGRRPEVRRSRSTQLAQWRPLLAVGGVRFVNLQHGEVAPELRELAEETGVPVHHRDDCDARNDIDDLAARIAALDLVISVDNSVVHLAGALNVPVWTLLPFAADFRWMRGTDRSPWYPSMRLYRQSRARDWGPLLERVAAELDQLAVDFGQGVRPFRPPSRTTRSQAG